MHRMLRLAERRAYPVRGAYCGGVAAGRMLLHWQGQSWPERRAMKSLQKSSVTDSNDQWSAGGTNGSFFAAAGGSSYCAGALTSITG